MTLKRESKQHASATSTLVRSRGKGDTATRVVIASALELADNFVTRSKGVLGRESLPNGFGLWIKRCNSIHTFFMKIAIDVVFLDKKMRVVAVYRDLKPWRITRIHFRATSVVELPSGALDRAVETATGLEGERIQAGDILTVETAKVSGGSNG